MPAAYHSAPVLRFHRFQAGTATVMKAANSIATRNSCPHMRIEWKTVWPPRSVLPPKPRIRDAAPLRAMPPRGGGRQGPGRSATGPEEGAGPGDGLPGIPVGRLRRYDGRP